MSERRLRVTFAAYDDDPPLGGQGVMLHGMRAALEQRGVAVRTLSGRGAHAIAYRRWTGRPPLDLSLHLAAHPRLLDDAGGDVIHAHGGPGGVLLLRRLRVPLVYTAHHTYRQAHRAGTLRRAMAPLEARAYRHAARVLPVSRSTADAVMAMGVAGSRIEVVPPGIAVPDLADDRHEAPRLLFVGRLEPEKGVRDAVDVMRRVIASNPQARGVVVGGGSLEAEVRAWTGAVERISFLGTVDQRTLDAEYARAGIVLMPSRYEGLGLVALEAQAHGAAVAGYAVDGLRDAVRDGGVLVTAGDVDALTRAVGALAGDPARAASLGEHGREQVRREHDWRVIASRLEEIYRDLLVA